MEPTEPEPQDCFWDIPLVDLDRNARDRTMDRQQLPFGSAPDRQDPGRDSGTTPRNMGGTGALYVADWLSETEQQRLIAECENLLPARACIRMYGRTMERPRETAWMARNGQSYRYGGTTDACQGWPQFIDDLSSRIAVHELWEPRLQPNCALLNVYRHDNDHVSWHADNEPEKIDQSHPIASVSLGAPRRFMIREMQSHKRAAEQILEPGSLLIMPAGFQQGWEHQIPRVSKRSRHAPGVRYNLTLRVLPNSPLQ